MATGNRKKKKSGLFGRGNVRRSSAKKRGLLRRSIGALLGFVRRWFWGFAFWAALIGIVAVGGYALTVSPEIITKFEGRRWRIPSKVYSDSLTLIPGQNLEAVGLIKRLERLNYQESKSRILRPGEFKKAAGVIDIHLRDFQYPKELQQGYLLRVRVDKGAIAGLINVSERRDVYTAEIEPELIARFFGDEREERDLVRLDEIPPTLINAVLAIEDRYFYLHPGVNPVSTVRAVIRNLIRFGGAPGGSTVTQQLVKNFYLTPERTVTRKLKEMVRALVLDVIYSKDQILEAYLNEIYFGQSGSVAIHGVGQASRFFFQKDVRSLNLAESATLAALIRSPGLYNPRKAIDRAKARRNLILSQMLDQGLINREQFDRAQRLEIRITRHRPQRTIAPYFVDFLRDQLIEVYSEDVLVSEGLTVFTTLDPSLQELAENALQSGIADLEKRYPRLKSDPKHPLQAAIVVLEPNTGNIRAMMGGRSYRETQFNRVVAGKRQPGSVFKPFVYLAGFERARDDRDFHFTAADLIEDGPVVWKQRGSKDWKPNNYKNKDYGTVTVRMGLEKSINRVTVMLAKRIGLDRVLDAARSCGIKSRLPRLPSVTLGAVEVSPLEVAAAYGTLASQGSYAVPFSIKEVVAGNGQILDRETIRIRQAVSPQAAYLTTHLLEGVIERGTGAGARARGFHHTAAGKTGTTDNYRDAWFVGYTPNLLCAVWVGHDVDKVTGLSGASGALPIWTSFMKKALAGQTDAPFPVPPGIEYERIDRLNGRLAVYGCPEKIDEAFLAGTAPAEKCQEHEDPILERFRRLRLRNDGRDDAAVD